MADGGTITHRITDLIGSDAFSDTVLEYEGDLINAAINEVADSISEDLLLKYSTTPTNVTSASGVSIEDKKILRVIRVDANSPNGIDRECTFLSETEYSAAADSGSIYQATKYSPVYTVYTQTAASEVLIHPVCNSSGQVGRIWYFPYVADGWDSTGLTQTNLNTVYFLPNDCIHALALKASINIMTAYISNQVQDEEDEEMLRMVQAQLQSLEKSYHIEIARFMDESGKPGGE
jgi:hypothetical protein